MIDHLPPFELHLATSCTSAIIMSFKQCKDLFLHLVSSAYNFDVGNIYDFFFMSLFNIYKPLI